MMNKNISRLTAIAEKESRLIIGLMSGTSLDGLDVALCEIKGSGLGTKISVKAFITEPYNADFKNEVKEIFSKKNIDLQKLCLLNEWIGSIHATIANNCLEKWNIKNSSIDIIASHGQTIFHAPSSLHKQEKFGNGTLQIGDGDHIATATGILTISDFRQKNIAAGGEGAPLAIYGDYLLFSKKDEERILLNIGGIANFTYLPGSLNTGNIFSTDIGPGNTMMDALMQQNFTGEYFDKDARIARKGTVHENLLRELKSNDFFKLPFPKSTGPELFNLNYLQLAKEKVSAKELSIEDTMATLNKFTADTISTAIKNYFTDNTKLSIYCSGGGMHNPLLMEHLQQQLPDCSFDTTASLGIDPDAKEAVLFAILANECICGNPDIFNGGKMIATSMGKLSFPY